MESLNFLLEYINVITLGICLCVGYSIKQAFEKIDNKYIPLIMLILGTIINGIINIHQLDMGVILGGMISGLASTGLYEMFRNLIQKNQS